MYSEGGMMMVAGVLLSLGFIAFSVYYVNTKISGGETAVWIV